MLKWLRKTGAGRNGKCLLVPVNASLKIQVGENAFSLEGQLFRRPSNSNDMKKG